MEVRSRNLGFRAVYPITDLQSQTSCIVLERESILVCVPHLPARHVRQHPEYTELKHESPSLWSVLRVTGAGCPTSSVKVEVHGVKISHCWRLSHVAPLAFISSRAGPWFLTRLGRAFKTRPRFRCGKRLPVFIKGVGAAIATEIIKQSQHEGGTSCVK